MVRDDGLCLLLRHLGSGVSKWHPNYADLLLPIDLMAIGHCRGANVDEVIKVVGRDGLRLRLEHLHCRRHMNPANAIEDMASGAWRRLG